MPRRTPCPALAAAVVVAALWPATASAVTRSVDVADDFFAPKTVRVAPGSSVKWVWRSGRHRHNVASPSFGDSGVRRRGSFTVRFARVGSYRYYCFLHDGMTGTVVVRR